MLILSRKVGAKNTQTCKYLLKSKFLFSFLGYKFLYWPQEVLCLCSIKIETHVQEVANCACVQIVNKDGSLPSKVWRPQYNKFIYSLNVFVMTFVRCKDLSICSTNKKTLSNFNISGWSNLKMSWKKRWLT